jgi:NADH-quinone oxidoreductase subunit M
MSLLFLPATALLFCGAIVAGWRVAPRRATFAGPVLRLAAAARSGDARRLLCARHDPVLLLLGVHAAAALFPGQPVGRRRRPADAPPSAISWSCWRAAYRCSFGFLALAFGPAGDAAAGLRPADAARQAAAGTATQYLVFLLLLLGFGAKVPLVPLHTWLPSLAMGAPVAVTALIVGLKLGAYGLIRLAIPLAPIAARDLHWLLAGFGTVAILYGAVAALVHSNLRGMLAYSSLSHVGLVLLGLASFSVYGLQGACCSCSTSASPPAAPSWCCRSCSGGRARPTSRNSAAPCAACPDSAPSSCSSASPASACRGPAASRASC